MVVLVVLSWRQFICFPVETIVSACFIFCVWVLCAFGGQVPRVTNVCSEQVARIVRLSNVVISNYHSG